MTGSNTLQVSNWCIRMNEIVYFLNCVVLKNVNEYDKNEV